MQKLFATTSAITSATTYARYAATASATRSLFIGLCRGCLVIAYLNSWFSGFLVAELLVYWFVAFVNFMIIGFLLCELMVYWFSGL